MFFLTDMCGKSAKSWNTSPMLRFSGGSVVMFFSDRCMVP